MHFACPHCQNPIELADVPASGEVACAGCGASFHLDPSATRSYATAAGKRIGKFELLTWLGQGAFGSVFKARDTDLDRVVAIKVPRAGNVGSGPESLDRFLREARAVAQLRFPSIVAIHEVGLNEGNPYLVSDFIEGITLADVLTGRRLSFKESAKLIAEVADALQYAHSLGVIHRDVKPSNIMIRPNDSPCVMDFGLAKRDAGEITMTMDGQVLGTPAYMSPEQARGEGHHAVGTSDIYSLGVILYQLLTGELPFRGNSRMLLHQVLHDDPKPPRSLNDRIPRDLETIALKAMAKEPGRRYESAKELADDLRRWLAGEPILARRVGSAERVWRWCKRNPTPAMMGAVLAVVIVVAFGTGAWQLQQTTAALTLAENREKERDNAQKQRALAQIGALVEVAPAAVPTILMELEANRDHVLPRLQELYAAEPDRRKRMRLALALLPVDPDNVRDELADWMIAVKDPGELSLLRDALTPLAPQLPKTIRERVLDEVLMDRDGARFNVLLPLVAVARDQFLPGLLAELDRQPTPPPSSETEVFKKEGAVPPDDLASRQANAALALMRMNQPDRVWPLLKNSPDPTRATWLIDRFASRGIDLQVLVKRLQEESEESIGRAIIIALREYPAEAWSADQKAAVIKKMQATYEEADDPGLHAASEWLLREWKQGDWLREKNHAWAKDGAARAKRLEQIGASLAKPAKKGKHQWYVDGKGHTMVVIPGPVEFVMGSTPTEKDRWDIESQHRKRINRTFAIAAKPVTVSQFRQFNPAFSFNKLYAPEDDCPINAMMWYEAAAYCNWLSKQEELPPQEWCYETDAMGKVVKLKADYLRLTGYRLPTEAEWEYACRAETTTARYFGDAEELLGKYAWYLRNTSERSWEVGRKPGNAFGFFDMHGNVWNWCQETEQAYPKSKGETLYDDKEDALLINPQQGRAMRGGSFHNLASHIRSSQRFAFNPTSRGNGIGFRPSRTLSISSLLRIEE